MTALLLALALSGDPCERTISLAMAYADFALSGYDAHETAPAWRDLTRESVRETVLEFAPECGN